MCAKPPVLCMKLSVSWAPPPPAPETPPQNQEYQNNTMQATPKHRHQKQTYKKQRWKHFQNHQNSSSTKPPPPPHQLGHRKMESRDFVEISETPQPVCVHSLEFLLWRRILFGKHILRDLLQKQNFCPCSPTKGSCCRGQPNLVMVAMVDGQCCLSVLWVFNTVWVQQTYYYYYYYYSYSYLCSLLIYTPSSGRHQPRRNRCVYRINCP